MQGTEYLNIAAVVAHIEGQGALYQKKQETALRRIASSEIGQTLITYVADGAGYREESRMVLGENHIIARNEARILGQTEQGENVYNTWAMERATAEKNYGQDEVAGLQTDRFTSLRKKALVRAVPITAELIKMCGGQGEDLYIKVSWAKDPMHAKVGDYLTMGGYSISAADMSDYVRV